MRQLLGMCYSVLVLLAKKNPPVQEVLFKTWYVFDQHLEELDLRSGTLMAEILIDNEDLHDQITIDQVCR